MFEDILGNKENKKDEHESLIESMKYNIEQKNKFIKTLLDRIDQLEEHIKKIAIENTEVGI